MLGDAGILAGQTGLEVSFGRTLDSAVGSVSLLAREKPAQTDARPDCGPGRVQVVRYASGLSLVFRDGALRGWSVSGGETAPAPNGVRIGQTRAEVAALAGDASISGDALRMGGMTGRFGADGRLAALWAGQVC